VEEELYVALAASDGGWDDFLDLPVEVGDAVRDSFDGEFVDFRVANDSAFANVAAAGFELGLDEDDRFGECGCGGENGSEKEGCGDEGDVHDEQGEFGLPGFSERVRGEESGVGALDKSNTRVVAKLHGDLAESGVDRGYVRGAALQKAVGEAARGCADIEAGSACDVDFPVVESGLEFETAAADIGHVVAEEANGGIGCDGGAGFVDFLFVDEYAAGEDEGTGALATLDEASVNEKNIDAGFAFDGQGLSSFPGSRCGARMVARTTHSKRAANCTRPRGYPEPCPDTNVFSRMHRSRLTGLDWRGSFLFRNRCIRDGDSDKRPGMVSVPAGNRVALRLGYGWNC